MPDIPCILCNRNAAAPTGKRSRDGAHQDGKSNFRQGCSTQMPSLERSSQDTSESPPSVIPCWDSARDPAHLELCVPILERLTALPRERSNGCAEMLSFRQLPATEV